MRFGVRKEHNNAFYVINIWLVENTLDKKKII